MRRQWVKEELRKDEIVSTTVKVIQFIKTRKKLVQYIGIVILSVGVLVAVGLMWWNNRQAKAIDKIDQANALYDQNQNKEARELYQAIVNEFRYTDSAAEALFYIGNCDFNLGEYDKAIETYRTYLKKYPNKLLASFAYESIGLCQEEKGDYKWAIETYRQLIEKYPQNFILPKIYLDLGRCYLALNDKAEAQKQYQKILDFYPNSVWVAQAKDKITALNPLPAGAKTKQQPANVQIKPELPIPTTAQPQPKQEPPAQVQETPTPATTTPVTSPK